MQDTDFSSQKYELQAETVGHMKSFLRELKDYKNIEELQRKIIELQKELSKLKQTKKYGLVWEEKLEIFDKETQNKLPVLEEVTQKHIIENDSENHILIQGDNYHTLSVLNYTHKGKIDVIYIDPPYNTGNKSWRYNNNYVEKDDTFRHSKWLSFMNKRLILAKNLLTENGCLIFAIDDYEVSTSKLLLDEIFGEDNRLGTICVVHNNAGRSDDKFFATSHEYMLIYGFNREKSYIKNFEIDEKIAKTYNFQDEISKYKLTPLKKGGVDSKRKDRPTQHYPIYVSNDLSKISTLQFEEAIEIFPIDNDGVERVWRNSKSTFENKIVKNEIILSQNKDKKISIFYKNRITKYKGIKPKTHWIEPRYNASTYGTIMLSNILGESYKFNFPKSLHLVLDILKISSQKNSIILDFFAGSGTTGHAVLELNKEDGGNRKFILATNNENNICEEVTYQRVKKVIQGYKNKKGEKIEGLGGNLRYLKTAFINKVQGNDDLRKRMVSRCSKLLCLKENIWNPVKITHEYIVLFERNDRYLAILYDMFYFDDFLQELQKLEKPISVYCFSYYPLSQEDFESIEQDISIEQIPDPILEVYESIFGL